jgi:hypothetical protein
MQSYVPNTWYSGTVHTIIENSGTNQFLGGTVRTVALEFGHPEKEVLSYPVPHFNHENGTK